MLKMYFNFFNALLVQDWLSRYFFKIKTGLNAVNSVPQFQQYFTNSFYAKKLQSHTELCKYIKAVQNTFFYIKAARKIDIRCKTRKYLHRLSFKKLLLKWCWNWFFTEPILPNIFSIFEISTSIYNKSDDCWCCLNGQTKLN